MRGYELTLILHHDTGEESIESLTTDLRKTITERNGTVVKIEKWGKKNFKYSIKRQTKGSYLFIFFTGEKDIMQSIERSVKFNESVLRYAFFRDDSLLSVETVSAETAAEDSVRSGAAPKDVAPANGLKPEAQSQAEKTRETEPDSP